MGIKVFGPIITINMPSKEKEKKSKGFNPSVLIELSLSLLGEPVMCVWDTKTFFHEGISGSPLRR